MPLVNICKIKKSNKPCSPTDSIVLFLLSITPPSAGQPYLCTAHWPRGLLSHRATSTSRGFPSYLGTSTPSTRGPLHAPNSSSNTSLRDRSLPASSFFKKSGLAFGTLSSATDAEDNTSFDDVPFATMTLLSNKCFASDSDPQEGGDGVEGGRKLMPESVFRMPLASKYGRDVLCVDIAAPAPAAPGTVLRLLNVHLDSLDSLLWRTQQMEILAGVLREPGCGGGLIAGDFNAITPEDDGLVDKNELVDAWVALHGRTGPNGVTWGVGVELKNGLKPGRLDKVAMLGLKAEEMEVLQLGLIHVPRPAGPPLDSPWSDHCGLRCTFTI